MLSDLGLLSDEMQAALEVVARSTLYSDLSCYDNKALNRAVRIMAKQVNKAYKQLAAMMNAVEPREQDHSGADWNAH